MKCVRLQNILIFVANAWGVSLARDRRHLLCLIAKHLLDELGKWFKFRSSSLFFSSSSSLSKPSLVVHQTPGRKAGSHTLHFFSFGSYAIFIVCLLGTGLVCISSRGTGCSVCFSNPRVHDDCGGAKAIQALLSKLILPPSRLYTSCRLTTVQIWKSTYV